MNNFAAQLVPARRVAVGLTEVLTILLTGCTVLTLFARHWWLADLCANLRVQGLIGLITVVLFAWLLKQRRLVILASASILSHSPWMIYAIDRPDSPATIDAANSGEIKASSRASNHAFSRFRVTTANVHTSNTRLADIEACLLQSGSDVIAVVELSTLLESRLAEGRFAQKYPHSRTCAQDNGNFGLGLYSRRPLESAETRYFNDDSICSVLATVRVAGQPVKIVATHTLPPMGESGTRHRNRHLHLLSQLIQQDHAADPETSTIVMGDLNVTPWSPIFSDFVSASGLTPAGRGFGLTPTWYAVSSFPFGLILDHVLMTSDWSCSAYSVGGNVGSDHRFVTADLRMKSSKQLTPTAH